MYIVSCTATHETATGLPIDSGIRNVVHHWCTNHWLNVHARTTDVRYIDIHQNCRAESTSLAATLHSAKFQECQRTTPRAFTTTTLSLGIQLGNNLQVSMLTHGATQMIGNQRTSRPVRAVTTYELTKLSQLFHLVRPELNAFIIHGHGRKVCHSV